VACRTARPKAELRRLVRTPDGSVRFDPTGRLAGRGAYLCADPACWKRASTKGTLERALSTQLPPDITAMLAAGALEPTIIEGGARGQE
jgi:predicted RNA-binding protein YlxR (DUF448 family)